MLKCKICKKQLIKYQKKYCSRICQGKAMSIRMKKTNPMKNSEIAKKQSKTLKKKIKNGFIPFMCTEKGKEIISKLAKERANSDKNPLRVMKGKTWEDFYGKEIAKLKKEKNRKRFTGDKNPTKRKEIRKKISRAASARIGPLNPHFGKPAYMPKKIKYKNIWMRSGWESKYAQYLDKNNIKWKYEPKTFYCGNLTYTPDFYLPTQKKYIEIKGRWLGAGKKKFNTFRKYYPNIKIELLKRKELKKLGIL